MAPVLGPVKPGTNQEQSKDLSINNTPVGLDSAQAKGREELKQSLRQGVTSSTHTQPDLYQRTDYQRDPSKLGADEGAKTHGYAHSSTYKRFSTAASSGVEVKGDVKMRFGRSDLTPEAQRVVDDVVAEINKIKAQNGGKLPEGTKITVDGYTDDRYHGKANGKDPEGIRFNQELSERRAEAVKQAIQKETGIQEGVIEAKGHGISHAHDNSTSKGRALNRRVDVAVDVPQQPKAELKTEPKSEPKPVVDPQPKVETSMNARDGSNVAPPTAATDKKVEVKPAPATEQKKDEPKPAPAASDKKVEVKPAPATEQKKDEPKPAPAASDKKVEVKPAPATEQKKDAPKPAPKPAPAAPADKKVEVKPDPATEQKKDEPKPTSEKQVEKPPVSYEELKDKAQKLHEALEAWNDDEVQIHKILSQLDAKGQKQLADYYRGEYDIDLDEHLASELGGKDLEVAQKLRAGAVTGTEEAVQINRSIEGLGTVESGVRAALKEKTPEQMQAMAEEYQRLYGESLEVALRGDLSGQELQDVLEKLNTDPMDKMAADLYTSMDGLGTDEAALFTVLAKLDKSGQEKLSAAYKAKYGVELDSAIEGELEGQELAAAQKLRQGASPEMTAAVAIYKAAQEFLDKSGVLAELTGKSPKEISAIASAYQDLFAKSLEEVLRESSVGQLQLRESLKLLEGKTFDLHTLIRSGNLTDKGVRDRIRELQKDPATLEEYKKWYGSDAKDDLSKRPEVQEARRRREDAKKTLDETDDL
jgi:outer membrane protein OmpA-like peptidoglycan-associated protein